MPGKLFILIVVFLFSGCASLPVTSPLPAKQDAAVRQSFKEMVSSQRDCRRSLDVSVAVSFKSLFFSGAIDGYLQAFGPAHIKFIGVNPLGQPLVIFTTDGEVFQFIDIPAAKAISGAVSSKIFRKYAPGGLDLGFSYYWLIGRLPPGKVKIMATSLSQKGDGVWVDLCCGPGNIRRKILFDPQKLIIKRHILLDDADKVLLDVSYDQFTSTACPLPGRLEISANKHKGRLEIVMAEWDNTANFSAGDFEIMPPPGFKRVVVAE